MQIDAWLGTGSQTVFHDNQDSGGKAGLKQSDAEPCLFFKAVEDCYVLLSFHMDDCYVVGKLDSKQPVAWVIKAAGL
jgi:hypothetical protein